jgi:hypothetical protein
MIASKETYDQTKEIYERLNSFPLKIFSFLKLITGPYFVSDIFGSSVEVITRVILNKVNLFFNQ